MGTRTISYRFDDLDGSDIDEDVEPVRFGLAGQSYEIDLSKANADRLLLFLQPFVDKARRVAALPSPTGKRPYTRRAPQTPRTPGDSTSDRRANGAKAASSKYRDLMGQAGGPLVVRRWAQQNGVDVGVRGRIPFDVIEQYLASRGDARPFDPAREARTRAADQRARQSADDRANEAARGRDWLQADEPARRGLNIAAAEQWRLSKHAEDRMQQRGLDRLDVLLAATEPAVTKPSPYGNGTSLHERESVRLVVDPVERVVLTTYGLNDRVDDVQTEVVAALHERDLLAV